MTKKIKIYGEFDSATKEHILADSTQIRKGQKTVSEVLDEQAVSVSQNTITLPDWTVNTPYIVGNQRQNDGHYYRCSTAHTSGETFDVADGWTEITDFVLGGTSLQTINIGSEATPIYQSCIKIVGMGTSGTAAGAKEGDIYYNTSTHLLRLRYSGGSYKTVPYVDGAVYTCNNQFYVWDGANLTQKTFDVDNVPEAGSENLVKSGGVKAALNAQEELVRDKMEIQASRDYLFVWLDANGMVLAGIRKNGEIYAPNLSIEEYNEKISELQDFLYNLNNDVTNLQDVINEDNTTETAVGRQMSFGSEKSEAEASPLVNDSDNFYVGYRIVSKERLKHATGKKIVMMNHDDGNLLDMLATRRIYNKYGFNCTSCAVFTPFESLGIAKGKLINYKKWLNDGNEIGLHAIIGVSYWKTNRMWDIKPNGSSTFAPVVAEIRGDEADGTGINTFGETITNSTKIRELYTTSNMYNNPNYDTLVVDITQAQLDDINRDYVIYGDRLLVSGLKSLDVNAILAADSMEPVNMTRLQWLEYYYNNLIDDTLGYSSAKTVLSEKFAEDYSIPSNSTIDDYYPDAAHILNGKMVYWNDSTNPNYSVAKVKTESGFSESDYQLVGKFTKGLYKDCFSTCNWEVMERVIQIAEAWFRHYFDGFSHFVDAHIHGQGYSVKVYKDENDIYYMNREKTIPATNGRFYLSNRGTFESVGDIAQSFGFSYTKEYTRRDWQNIHGAVGAFYGQQGKSQTTGVFCSQPLGVSIPGSMTGYLSLAKRNGVSSTVMDFATFKTFIEGIDDLTKFFLENGGSTVTRNGITLDVYPYLRDAVRTVLECEGTGKVPVISVDSIYNSPATPMAVELFLRFCKSIGYEIVGLGQGREKILSIERYAEGNLFPNPGFNQSLLQYIGGNSTWNDAYLPDGWIKISGSTNTYDVSEQEVNNVNTKVFTITGYTSTCAYIFGLPSGNYKFSFDAKYSGGSTGYLELLRRFNKDKINEEHQIKDFHPDLSASWSHHEVEFSIDDYHRNIINESNAISIICAGYEDNLCCLRFRVNPGNSSCIWSLANIKLIKN